MFIRKQRKRWELLHSCRDGAGRVYHRRLGHCADAVGLEQKLDEISRTCPEIRFDRTRLLEKILGSSTRGTRPVQLVETHSEAQADTLSEAQADTLSETQADTLSETQADTLSETQADTLSETQADTLSETQADSLSETRTSTLNETHCSPARIQDATRRCDKIRRSARALLRLLAEEEDASVLKGAEDELSLLSARLQGVGEVDDVKLHLSRLSPRRRQFDRSDLRARPYMAALDELSGRLELQGQLADALAVLGRRVNYCATPDVIMRYGALLQRAGHFDQAVREYSRLPSQEAAKHYNLASISVLQNRKEEAVFHLLKGLTHDPQANLHYDESFGIRTMTRQPIIEDKNRPIGPNPEYWQQFGHLWTAEGREFVRKLCSQALVRFSLSKSRKTGIRYRNLVPPASQQMLLGRIV